MRPEIDPCRQSTQQFPGWTVEKIAMIGKIGNPTVEEFVSLSSSRPLG